MSRIKRKSKAIEKANTRAVGLSSIDPVLDLGNGLTVVGFKTKITSTQTLLDTYNSKLSEVDAALNDVTISEKQLDDLSARMLAGVGTKFGRDSNQVEMAGGTRQSERKQPKRNGNGKNQPH